MNALDVCALCHCESIDIARGLFAAHWLGPLCQPLSSSKLELACRQKLTTLHRGVQRSELVVERGAKTSAGRDEPPSLVLAESVGRRRPDEGVGLLLPEPLTLP